MKFKTQTPARGWQAKLKTHGGQYVDLLLAMTVKEVKARYKHVAFGFLWMFLNPLLQMLIIGFVFQYVTRLEIEGYFLFLLTGLLVWNFLSETLGKVTPLMVFERALLKKARFPREVLVLAVVLAHGFHLVVSFGVFLPVAVWFFGFGWRMLWMLVAMGWLGVFVAGLSLLLTSWNVWYRDVSFFVKALLPLWFYMTPIVYGLEFLPVWMREWWYVNPMTGVVELFRYAVLGREIEHEALLGVSFGVSLLVAWLGVRVFGRLSPYFVDRV